MSKFVKTKKEPTPDQSKYGLLLFVTSKFVVSEFRIENFHHSRSVHEGAFEDQFALSITIV